VKEHVIGFRVGWDEYREIEKTAEKRGDEVTEWCRNLVLSESRKPFGLTASERILLEEIAVLRTILGVLAARILSPEELNELRENVNLHYEEYGRQVLEKRSTAGPDRASDGELEGAIEGA
jgi:hypothetical protein